jgi:hypothetical protein
MDISIRKQLMKEFKESIHNPDFMPTYCPSYGTKYDGVFKFKHFIFYSMLKNKNIEKTSHDIESTRFKFEVSRINFIASSGDEHSDEYKDYRTSLINFNNTGHLAPKINCYFERNMEILIKDYNDIFPSLTLEMFKKIVKDYYSER